nr:hypothetical protein CFP56_34449 [Quercus suber]
MRSVNHPPFTEVSSLRIFTLMTSLNYMFQTSVWLLYYCLVLRVRFNSPKSASNGSSVRFPSWESDETDLSNEDAIVVKYFPRLAETISDIWFEDRNKLMFLALRRLELL